MAGLLLARLEGLPIWAATRESLQTCSLDTGPGFAPFIGSFLGQIAPGSDAFITEKYAFELEALLKAWSGSLRSAPAKVDSIATSLPVSLLASPLGLAQEQPMRSNAPLTTARVRFPEAQKMGRAAFLASLRSYFSAFKNLQTAEFQVAGIEEIAAEPLSVRTEIVFDVVGDVVGSTSEGVREQRTGAWELVWQRGPQEQWLVTHWSALHESRSRLSGAGFVDITAATLGETPSYREQMLHGADYWRTLLDGATGIDVYGNNGLAVGDFDGDGLDDLYVCQAAGLPNRLYRNRGDGTLEDVTEKAGVGVLDATSSALFADLTNNGRKDLIVVRTAGPLLFVNRGDGTFTPKPDAFQFARASKGTFTAAAIADYDRDGLLDVYFCLYSYYQGLSEYQFPRPYYDAQNGPPNFLFHNRGDHSFEDVTVSSGMDANNNRYSFACGWNDFDKDGWPDLYVVNDFGRKNLYRNRGDGTFEDISAKAGVEDPGAGMSVCWMDYDNDSFDDLYVANMWTAAGRRVSAQKPFLPGAAESVRGVYRKHANGNSLFHNSDGEGTFRDVTEESGTRLGRWAWSSDAWDFDHDGFADLYVTNGFVSGPETEGAGKADLSSFFWRQVIARSLAQGGSGTDYEDAWSAINEFLRSDYSWSGHERNNGYINNHDGTFTEAAGVLGLDLIEDSRTFALLDLDGDGRLEVVLKNRNAPQLRVLCNGMEPLPPSIMFVLRGTKSNRDAIGAVVELTTPTGRQRKTAAAGSGFLAQHTLALHFGLGTAAGQGLRATVTWPSGAVQTFEHLSPGHRIEIEEGNPTFHSVPFRPRKRHAPATLVALAEKLPESPQTWLVEPVLAPAITVSDQNGVTRSLADGAGRPRVLLWCRSDCAESRRQLDDLERVAPEWKRAGLEVFAVCVDGKAPRAAGAYSFPIVTADATTAAVYNIFYRYLFERRRNIPLPAAFLLDGVGRVVKVYRGIVEPAEILADWRSAPGTAEARLQRAVAFRGLYFGAPLHHNYFTYGVAFFRYGFLDQASVSFEQAIANDPDFAGAYYNLGLIALQRNQVAAARTRLLKAIELDPANANAWNNLGVAYGREGEYDRAQSSFKEAQRLQPGHLLALQNEVKLLRARGRPAEAKTLLTAALAKYPAQASLRIELALLLIGEQDLIGARREFEAAVSIDPINVEALNGLGVVLMKMGEASSAEDRFKQCQRLAPAYDRAYLNLALLYLRAGDPGRAHDVLAGYLDDEPESVDVRRALAELDRRR